MIEIDNALEVGLEAQAGTIRPRPDLADVFDRIEHRQRRTRLTGVGTCVLLVVGAIIGALVVRHGDQQPATNSPVDITIGAISIGAVPAGGTLERYDAGAGAGPWSIVVRRSDGSFGLHSAVVVFPVAEPKALATPVAVGGRTGFSGQRTVVWPIGDQWARIRGDLDPSQLIEIAAFVRVVDGRPAVGSLDSFTVGPLLTYRPASIDEIRYGSTDLGEAGALGNGLAYTGVLSGGVFEDEVFETNGRPGFTVSGQPAVVSSVNGGNGTLAWEPTPGVVAYVGYSGTSMDDNAVAALVRLANRTTAVSASEWRATRPQISAQQNGPQPEQLGAAISVPGS